MSNVKAQSSNEGPISKPKLNAFRHWTFVIDLTFACLPVGRDFGI
jgi:hypothetical protein